MSVVEWRLAGGAAIVTLNRPERSNALSRDMVRELGALESTLLGQSALRAIVITGAGEKAFCAGADLKERAGMTDDEVRDQLRAYRSELGWIATAPVPVIGAVNGVALGGGLELLLLCDLRIAAPNAQFGLPETSLGIIPGAGGTQRLPRLVGSGRAKEMILLGRRLSSYEALEWGLIERVATSAETLLTETLSWLEPALAGAPIAQKCAKAAIDAASDLELAPGLEREFELYQECLASEDRKEALLAFREKRKPVFNGR
ncbi:MAG TPA: enoyl-CoA hydratase-related protein [Polyangiaceae bacterium]|nr:enoyl-CoA hydratase-related protein [Polyangiaceae bacterium]